MKVFYTTHLVVCFLFFFCLAAGVQADSENDGSAQYEIVFWESVKDSEDPRLFQSYLKKYPNGVFAEIAKLYVEKYGGSYTEEAASSPQEPVAPSSPVSPVRPDSAAPYKVALFPWNLLEDAHYMTTILTSEVKDTIDRYSCMELSHSYFRYNKKYGIKSLENSNSDKLNKRLLWRSSKPQVDYVAEFGQALGVDAVMMGSMRVNNPWSDRYKLGFIRIFLIDVTTKSVLKVKNTSSTRDAAEEFPILVEKIVGQFSSQFCNM